MPKRKWTNGGGSLLETLTFDKVYQLFYHSDKVMIVGQILMWLRSDNIENIGSWWNAHIQTNPGNLKDTILTTITPFPTSRSLFV